MLRYLNSALLVAERGVVCENFLFCHVNLDLITDTYPSTHKVFRDQEIDIYQQLELARHFGPLHRHATTPIPKIGLEEVHGQFESSQNIIEALTHTFGGVVVYNDASRKPDPSAFTKLELWHSDVNYHHFRIMSIIFNSISKKGLL